MRIDHHHHSWRLVDVVAVVIVQAVGLLVAYIAVWIAFFALPPESVGGANDPMTRVAGAVAALIGGLALPAGCWEAWRRTRNVIAGAVALLVTAGALVVAAAWAFELG